MNLFMVLLMFVSLFPLFTNPIRCYKCDATDECKTIESSKKNRYSSENLEIIDCEHYCWKSISLGNVYRGCAKKRCMVSHSMGTFSSSVCCETDYCNGSNQISSSKLLSMILILFLYLYSQR